MTKKRYYQCRKCDGRTWAEKAAQSKCRVCDEEGERIAKEEMKEMRQFKCRQCSGRTWDVRAEQSKCRKCGKMGEFIQSMEEMVGVCKFRCGRCKREFTVICRKKDRAECYGDKCKPLEKRDRLVESYEWTPRRRIKRDPRSEHKHSCTRCDEPRADGSKHCPNLE